MGRQSFVCDGFVPDGFTQTNGDNCDAVFNPEQSDRDGDGIGDDCDNCPDVYNAEQLDREGDGLGDACDSRLPEQVGDECLLSGDNRSKRASLMMLLWGLEVVVDASLPEQGHQTQVGHLGSWLGFSAIESPASNVTQDFSECLKLIHPGGEFDIIPVKCAGCAYPAACESAKSSFSKALNVVCKTFGFIGDIQTRL